MTGRTPPGGPDGLNGPGAPNRPGGPGTPNEPGGPGAPSDPSGPGASNRPDGTNAPNGLGEPRTSVRPGGAGGRGGGRRVVVLVNPAGGQRGAHRAAETVLAHLAAAGWDAEPVAGADTAGTLALARDRIAAGVDVLAVVGGDGMVHLGLQAVAGTRVPLAVVPAGTGNDFARALGIPRGDPAAAARLVTQGTPRAVDLARVGERWIGTVVACGFDALVTDRANRLRWPRGGSRYTLAVLVELTRLRPLPFRIRLDGGEVPEVELDATLVAVGNTAYYGGGMRVCPDADPYDSELAVTVVEGAGALRLPTILPRLYNGSHLSHPRVRTYRARRIELASAGVFAYADGEFVGDLPIVVEAVPQAVEVLLPG